jgi:hypothetical protein
LTTPSSTTEAPPADPAFRNLVDDDVEVNVDTGLRAAEKLQAA